MRKSMGQMNFIKHFLTVAFVLGQVRHADGQFFRRRNAGLGSLAARQVMCLFQPSIYSSESDSFETSPTKSPDSCGQPTIEQQRQNQQGFIDPKLQTKPHQSPGFDGDSKVPHGPSSTRCPGNGRTQVPPVEPTQSATNQVFPCKCCCTCSLREKPRDLS